MVQIILDHHTGYAGDENSRKSPEHLGNGQRGIGTRTDGSKVLVVSCGNCGDYTWIDLAKLLEEIA